MLPPHHCSTTLAAHREDGRNSACEQARPLVGYSLLAVAQQQVRSKEQQGDQQSRQHRTLLLTALGSYVLKVNAEAVKEPLAQHSMARLPYARFIQTADRWLERRLGQADKGGPPLG
jgi:hypothetical protein